MPSNPLPPNNNPSFVADYPSAFVYPAWYNLANHYDSRNNYYRPEGHGGVPNIPRAWVLHTPEEPSDNNETTPAYFAGPGRQASTHYYLDSDGDVFQLVPEFAAAIANGLKGKPVPSWAGPGSLNWQTLSVEIEGYAHSIHQTMPVGGVQFNALVNLIKGRAHVWGIPLDREHIMGHYQLSIDRSDPGAQFPWNELMEALGTPEVKPRRKKMLGWAIIQRDSSESYLVIDGKFHLIPTQETYNDLYGMIYGDKPEDITQATWEWLNGTVGIVRVS